MFIHEWFSAIAVTCWRNERSFKPIKNLKLHEQKNVRDEMFLGRKFMPSGGLVVSWEINGATWLYSIKTGADDEGRIDEDKAFSKFPLRANFTLI